MTSDLRDQLQSALGAAYTLEGELGGGGMSRVFEATETSLGRKVVVKVLPAEMAEGVSVERFRREIQLAARLQHPHIVPVLTVGEMSGLPYYTMPLVNGHSLRMRLAKGGPLPVTEAIGILRDVAKALAFAHEAGVVHRDIKPDNVLLAGGSAVVTDFGVAKAFSASKTSGAAGTITQVGSSLGTPAYMAPEQAAADPDTDHRADIYAFGVMAYEMLAGRAPFHGRTPQKLLAAQMSERPEPISDLRPDLPPLLAQLVMKCLEKEPDDRPQSAADLVRVLETVTSGGTHPAMPQILLGGRRRLWRALALYALAFVVVAIVAKAAIMVIGLPEWVFPGSLIVMALGLPVILFTAFVHYSTHQAMTASALTPGGSPVTHSTMTRLAVKASPWVSWRKTTMGGVTALGVFAALVVAFMVMRALGIGPAGSLLAAGKLRTNEQLLVTDFRSSGPDTSLGSIMTEAVRTDLGQSSVVALVPQSAVAAALDRMRRPDTSRLDLPLAREIAQREGIKAVVDGNIRQLGTGFLMSLRLVGAESGDELASYQETTAGPNELLSSVDKLTRQLRGKIGESLRAVRASPPLEHVTTSSLEALRKYVAASRANDVDGDFPKAIALLEEAVTLDTTFAMAYRKLGVAVQNNAGPLPQEKSDSAFARAYRYRDHLTERERYLATASYYDQGPGAGRQKAIAAYEALLARDSADDIALNNLGGLLVRRREEARAESLFRRSIATGRAGVNEHGNLINTLIDQGRLAEADSEFAADRLAFPGAPGYTFSHFVLLYARGQLDTLVAQLTAVRVGDADAGNRATATHGLSDMAMLHGRLAESERLAADALQQDAARGAPPPPLEAAFDSVWMDVWFRNEPARGVQKLDAALARTPLRGFPARERPYMRAAQLYAIARRPDRARALLVQYAADIKDSALLNQDEPDRHNVLGEIALAERRPLDAVTEFRLADRRVDGPANDCAPCLPSRLGRAFDQANLPDSTIAMYERYIATPFWPKVFGPFDPSLLAGMHKRLGELYEAKGDRTDAVSHYLKFIGLWKNADPELQPRVAEVRQRLARLRDTERR